ncbi:PDZ domain-containing protein [Pseudoxanthobacter soli DSM 19599]|uniref:PDZ domain-containing protein n=1 Tax=Pseudoxanthobacter soli DSM 19599 TaxID=1123029 RepID=A0A1M7Z7P0_9HYPH|nr:PDZ domain-containing protein [Pseudoxanthobacter soli]SHO60800.1 PDZ domain-containing protein [Pseudoxanthobacter soli DSM 19599]
MKKKVIIAASAIALSIAHSVLPVAGPHAAFAASPAAHGLPKPAISRALGALLMPINAKVAKVFKLDKSAHGLLVVSVKPGGAADKQGIKPGDVLVEIGGHKVKKPIDVDIAVRRGLKTGNSNYNVNIDRAGAIVALAAIITLESYNETYSVSEVSTWEATTTEESSFSYSEYVSEETTEIESAYTSEESVVEESVSSEETSSEESTSEETSSDESATSEDSSDDSASEDSNASDESATSDDSSNDSASDDSDASDESATSDDSSDDSASDGSDAVDDSSSDDGGSADDGGSDDGGDN